ncbi:MAG: REP-associated tyrosine transposase [Calditrichota bacterium]
MAFSGSVHFVTTVARIRGPRFIEEPICRELLHIFESYRSKYQVHCLGYVLMHDHFHALLTQECDNPIIPKLIQDFKKLTSQRLWRHRGKTGTLWCSRYDDVPVPGPDAVRTKMEYIHNNPIKAGLVEHAEDYLWSSASDYFLDRSGIVMITKW